MYDATHHFPDAHCRQLDFFSRLPPVFLLTLSCMILKRVHLRIIQVGGLKVFRTRLLGRTKGL
jgi:hypothetical protein